MLRYGQRHFFHIGRVTSFQALRNSILARVSHDMKLMGVRAANSAAVCLDGGGLQAQALKYSCVGVIHNVVTVLHTLRTDIEGVRILHDEFARSHDPKTRPNLITELGLYLIEVERQLSIAANFAASEDANHFFMGRADAKTPIVSIGQAQ